MSARDLSTVSGRLRAERKRLKLSQADMAGIAAMSPRTYQDWEQGRAKIKVAALDQFAGAGADILYIITARRENSELAGVTVRQALAMLDPFDRRRLLLELVTEELRG